MHLPACSAGVPWGALGYPGVPWGALHQASYGSKHVKTAKQQALLFSSCSVSLLGFFFHMVGSMGSPADSDPKHPLPSPAAALPLPLPHPLKEQGEVLPWLVVTISLGNTVHVKMTRARGTLIIQGPVESSLRATRGIYRIQIRLKSRSGLRSR